MMSYHHHYDDDRHEFRGDDSGSGFVTSSLSLHLPNDNVPFRPNHGSVRLVRYAVTDFGSDHDHLFDDY